MGTRLAGTATRSAGLGLPGLPFELSAERVEVGLGAGAQQGESVVGL